MPDLQTHSRSEGFIVDFDTGEHEKLRYKARGPAEAWTAPPEARKYEEVLELDAKDWWFGVELNDPS